MEAMRKSQKLLKLGRRLLCLVLSLVMVLGMIPATIWEANAASNMEGNFEGQEADVFTAMGFDTTIEPEGYDAETVDNPYGRDKIPGNQIFEMMVSSANGTAAMGNGDNSFDITDVTNVAPYRSDPDVPLKMFAAAAADFDNDGLVGEMVYVGYDSIKYGTWSEKASLKLMVYDAKKGTMSNLKTISTAINPGQVITSGGGNYAKYDYAWQNLLQVTAGDYDGDGVCEIAVYVAEDGNNRVEIYKYLKTSETPANGWMNMSNWCRVWAHVVNNTGNLIDNMVSLVSGDINRDGVDDLGIASGRVAPHGRPFSSMSMRKSEAVILWGSRNDMLQSRTALELSAEDVNGLCRVSLLFEDLDGDGYKDLIATGQPYDDLTGYMTSGVVSNTTRSVLMYTYDGVSDMVISYSGNLTPVNGTLTNDEEAGEIWQSGNGFDNIYYSSPLMRTNAAVFNGQGREYTMLYLDSCLYECVEGQLNLKCCLDDELYDTENKLNQSWITKEKYTEFGVVSADINGDGYDQLYTSFYTESSTGTSAGTEDTHLGGFSGLAGSETGLLRTSEYFFPDNDPMCLAVTAVDVDMDTVIIEYTGNHYLEYSDPEVLAIIAAAPYFEDVDVICNYDYAWQNTTSWSTTSGGGEGDLVAVDLEIGAYFSTGNAFGTATFKGLFELETSINFTMEWEKETVKTTEYTLTFETSQDEDSVAFFSVPTENYVYNIYVPDGNGGYLPPREEIISNTFQPVYQILTLDYYESIRKDYEGVLPPIAGEAITSTPGDPASYPSSSNGYDVIAEWNKAPAGVSFGNGAITQEITITEEKTESYNLGAALDFQAGGGFKYDGAFAESENTFGAQFSLNPTGGWSTIDLSGTSISGTVTNMPLEFQDYGYYFNWKLFSYNYKFGNGNSIPVVSYIVNDVSKPPLLPTDFQQDVERTTSDKNVLTWTYDGSYTKFIIYKYFDFPVGGGLQVVAEYETGEAPFVLKYDANNKPYKEFYFEDTNLAAYTEYQYAIQVERLNKVPPRSAPSGLVTARTKAAYGYPVNTVMESDGVNDGKLLMYPDKNSYLTVGVTGPEGQSPVSYYSTVQYQWQKQERGAWKDMVNETNKTLTILNAGSDTAGTYRCRVNVQTKADATGITSYTDAIVLTHSKRSSFFEEMYAMDVPGGGIVLYAKVANAHSDSAAIPSGDVSFVFTHTQTQREFKFRTNLNTAGVINIALEDTLPEGMYTVHAYYSGSYTFKSCSEECLYLSEIDSGYHIDAPNSLVYGDGGNVTFQYVEKVNGMAECTPVDADSYSFVIGFQTTTKALPNARECKLNQDIGGGNYYIVGDDGVRYYFNCGWTLQITELVNGYAISNYNYTSYFFNKGADDGKYQIKENAWVYPMVIKMTKDGVTSCAAVRMEQRAVELQLPVQKLEESTTVSAPAIKLGDLEVVSGGWANCDMANGKLTGSLASTAVNVSYINTAGKSLTADTVLDQCGYYVTKSNSSNRDYKLIFRNGSMTVIGGSKEVTIGVRDFEDQDVGTLYVVSPDYDYTRSEITDSDKLVQAHAVGSRMVFTAVPDEGYEIYDWYINGVAQGNKKTSISYVVLNENATVEVQFAIKKNSLIFGVAGAIQGGTLTCSDPDITSDSVVLANSYFTFTAKAKDGYHFKEWRYSQQGKGTVYNDDDYGKQESTFDLLMPAASCSLYAVFERDTYTFQYMDLNGASGLTAWYWDNPSGDATVGLEKVTIESGSQVPGGTQIVVEAAPGYDLDPDYNFVSSGTQGVADYDAGTYTLVLEESTLVTGYAIRQNYDVTLKFNAVRKSGGVVPDGAQIIYTIDGEEHTFDYREAQTSYTIQDVPGGSSITAEIVYPGYYILNGWTTEDHKFTASTEKDPAAAAVLYDAEVLKGGRYYYEASVNGSVTRFYFVAPLNGVVRFSGSSVTIYDPELKFTIPALDKAETISVQLTEKPVYKVTLANIDGKGTYSFELPGGAKVENHVVTCHENDPVIILVTPAQKWTVSYWQVGDGTNTMKTRATSLKYQFPTLTANYTFTPIFSSTTYNTISWPDISADQNGLTLSPESGYLSSVTSGNNFKFRLTGSTYFLEKVMANGYPFEPAETAEEGYANTYQDVNGVRIYTIHNITENQVISATTKDVGIAVNGVDLSRASGAGWKFDFEAQTLNITKPGLTVSGEIVDDFKDLLSKFSITLGSEVSAVNISGVTLNSSAPCIIRANTSALMLTFVGTSSFTGNQFINATGDLTIRGNAEFSATNTSDSNALINVAGNMSIGSNLNMTVTQNGTANAVTVGGSLTVGSGSSNPVVKIVQTGSTTAGTQFGTNGTAISASSIDVVTGELVVSGADYALAIDTLDVSGGVLDLNSDNAAIGAFGPANIIRPLNETIDWIVSIPNGFARRYIDDGYLETTETVSYSGTYTIWGNMSSPPVYKHYRISPMSGSNNNGVIKMTVEIDKVSYSRNVESYGYYAYYVDTTATDKGLQIVETSALPSPAYNKDNMRFAAVQEGGTLTIGVFEWDSSNSELVEHTANTTSYSYTFTGRLTNITAGSREHIDATSETVRKVTFDNVTFRSFAFDPDNWKGHLYLIGDNYLINPSGTALTSGYAVRVFSDDGAATLTLHGKNYAVDASYVVVTNLKAMTMFAGTETVYDPNFAVNFSYYGRMASGSDSFAEYKLGWLMDAGDQAATAQTLDKGTIDPATMDYKYTKVYPISKDATISPVAMVYNPDLEEKLLFTYTGPVVNGYVYDRDGVGIYDSEGNKCSLSMYANGHSDGSVDLFAYGSDMKHIPVGEYTARVDFKDGSYIEMPISLVRGQNIVEEEEENLALFAEPSVTPGSDVEIVASYTGDETPSAYEWYIGDVKQSESGAIFEYSVPADAQIGDTYTIKAVAKFGSTVLEEAQIELTVINSAVAIDVSCVGQTPADDGSYTLHHVTADGTTASWTFDATTTMADGTTNKSVVWSLWGAQLRTTTINSETGVLTISPKERGTQGKLQVKATYTNADGTTYTKSVDVYLSTDAYIAYGNADTQNGVISSAVCNGIEIPASGTYVPADKKVVITAEPAEGFEVANWYVNGVSVSGNEAYIVGDNTLTFTSVAMTHCTITAGYTDSRKKITIPNQLMEDLIVAGTAEITSAEYGDSSITTNESTTLLKLSYNGTATITFTPASGYKVDEAILKSELEEVVGTTAQLAIEFREDAAVVTLTGVTADLDFSNMKNPFVIGPSVTLKAVSLSFENEVFYNLFVESERVDIVTDENGVATNIGLLVYNEKPKQISIDNAADHNIGAYYHPGYNTYIVRSDGVAAKKLGDEVYFVVYVQQADGSYLFSDACRYSARTYATNRIEKSTDDNMRALCVAMLNYGAAAQQYFSYKTDDLVNANLTAAQQALVKEYDPDMVSEPATVSTAKLGDFAPTDTGFKSKIPNVTFDGAFAINYFFTADTDVDSMTFYYWNVNDYLAATKLTADNCTGMMEMEKTGKTNEFLATVEGISAKEIDATVFVCGVYTVDGETYCTGVLSYSLGRYCENKAAEKSEAALLAKGTAVYGYYAKVYFSNRK